MPLSRRHFVAALAALPLSRARAAEADEIRLLVRADDMGAAQSVNEACIQCSRDGIARSVEVIVAGPWFLDAARLLKANPSIDVGVHLCLTSEWERVKWGPLTNAPSLVDADGYFHPMTSQRNDFPPNTGFLQCGYKLEEVEAELRAQIESARRHIANLSHLSAHMGAAAATPQLRAISQKLAKEFKLGFGPPGLKSAGQWSGNSVSAEQKEKNLAELLQRLSPGTYLIVEHPAHDTPEMRAISHKGYENVAEHRAGVTRAFTSPDVKRVIDQRRIRLISYADLNAEP